MNLHSHAKKITTPLLPYLLIVVLLAALSHYYGLFGDFISDDWPQIAENPYLKSSKYIPGFFTKDVWANSGIAGSSNSLYRPLFLLWNYAVFTIFGANPFAFHCVLLVTHLLNSALFFILAGRLLPDSTIATRVSGSIFFALHPSASLCISWIAAGGTYINLLFFILISMLSYLNYRETGKKIHFGVSLIFYSFSLLTNESAVLFLALFIMTDFLKKPRIRELPYPKYFAYFFICLIYIIARSTVVSKGAMYFTSEGLIRFGEYIFLSFRYLLFPWNLPFYFEYPPDTRIASTYDILAGLCAISIFLAFWIKEKKYFYPIGWMVITLLLPLGVAFHQHGVFAVRFLYLPAIGLGIGIVLAFQTIKISRNLITVFCVLTFLIFTVINFYTSRDFANEEVFFKKITELNPQAQGGYIGLVSYYSRIKNDELANKVLINGLKTVTSDEIKITLYEKLGINYGNQGKYAESISCFEEILKLSKNNTSAYIGLGNNYWITKRYEEALEAYYKAIEIEPKNFLALYNYASLLKSTGKIEEAGKFYIKMLELPPDPNYPQAIMEAKKYIGVY